MSSGVLRSTRVADRHLVPDAYEVGRQRVPMWPAPMISDPHRAVSSIWTIAMNPGGGSFVAYSR